MCLLLSEQYNKVVECYSKDLLASETAVRQVGDLMARATLVIIDHV